MQERQTLPLLVSTSVEAEETKHASTLNEVFSEQKCCGSVVPATGPSPHHRYQEKRQDASTQTAAQVPASPLMRQTSTVGALVAPPSPAPAHGKRLVRSRPPGQRPESQAGNIRDAATPQLQVGRRPRPPMAVGTTGHPSMAVSRSDGPGSATDGQYQGGRTHHQRTAEKPQFP